MTSIKTAIIGTGAYAPEKVLTNKDLEKIVETSDEWIVERTGIRERHLAAEGEVTSDMALKASVRALEMASTRPEELDLVIVGTVTPDMPFPACAAFLQHKLGAKNAMAFDISAACAGSIFGLSIGDMYIRAGTAKRVLVIGTELLSSITDWQDRNTCILFGDAAGAMVLGPSPDPQRGILGHHLRTEGSLTDILCLKAGGSKYPMTEERLKQKMNKVFMNGREVYKFAVRALTESSKAVLEANGLTPAQVTHVIAHQANIRIIDAILERLEVPREKCWLNIEKYGNTSSASLPTTLDEANRAGRLKKGDVVLMMAIGAGMAYGSSVVRW
ncbi:MAG TPA: beta-ketoacyl-ACP synthase III [Myxococcaceae bacterium]|nr:beta-ketoacyl-ACP synthase III [Myxococcaceae bacterium]